MRFQELWLKVQKIKISEQQYPLFPVTKCSVHAITQQSVVMLCVSLKQMHKVCTKNSSANWQQKHYWKQQRNNACDRGKKPITEKKPLSFSGHQ